MKDQNQVELGVKKIRLEKYEHTINEEGELVKEPEPFEVWEGDSVETLVKVKSQED